MQRWHAAFIAVQQSAKLRSSSRCFRPPSQFASPALARSLCRLSEPSSLHSSCSLLFPDCRHRTALVQSSPARMLLVQVDSLEESGFHEFELRTYRYYDRA